MELPGNTTEESIKILLEAIKDPSNRVIKKQIKRALNEMGVSDREIAYYEMTGERIDWPTGPDFDADMDGFRSEMDAFTKETNAEMRDVDRMFNETFATLNRRKKSYMRTAIMGFIISGLVAIAVIFGLLISGVDDNEVSTKDIPTISEPAPTQDGDKL